MWCQSGLWSANHYLPDTAPYKLQIPWHRIQEKCLTGTSYHTSTTLYRPLRRWDIDPNCHGDSRRMSRFVPCMDRWGILSAIHILIDIKTFSLTPIHQVYASYQQKIKVLKCIFECTRHPFFSFPLYFLSNGPLKWEQMVVASEYFYGKVVKIASQQSLIFLTGIPTYQPPFRG